MKLKEMRALTITQPWAECILMHGKNVENRTWNTHQRGFIAIHASSSYDTHRFMALKTSYGITVDPNEVEYGAIIGFARLVDVVTEDDLTKETKKWFEGFYGFVFDEVIMLKTPVPVKGHLNFWKVKGKTLKDCLAQLNGTQLKKLMS